MKKRSIKRKILYSSIALVFLLSSVGFAGFLTQMDFQGTVGTAKVTTDIIDYSGTWVYKNLETHDLVRLPYISDDPNLLLIASATAHEHVGDDYDVDFVFDNIFPCVDFTGDFVFHYTGSIPVVISDIFFNADLWLEPYIRWEAYKCHWENDQWVLDERIYLGQQLHYCDHVHVDVTVHIPQDNELQDMIGMFSGGVELIQWNDYCTKSITLPSTPVTSNSVEGIVSYFNTTLTDVPPGFTVIDGHYLGWCVDRDVTMPLGTDLVTTLWNSYDVGNPYPDEDWDKVNYIINHKQGSRMQIQNAIWHFIDGGYTGNDSIVLSMIHDADTFGEGFVPTTGQWIAVVCEFETVAQWIFIEVDP